MRPDVTDAGEIIEAMYRDRVPLTDAGAMVYGPELWNEMLNYQAWPKGSKMRKVSINLRKASRVKI